MPESTEIFRRSEPESRYLVVINKGPGAVPFPRDGAAWDLLEIYFKAEDIAAVKGNPAITDAQHVVFETDRNRRKFAILKSVFEAGDWWKAYDAVLIADDDVEPVGCTVADIFSLFQETGCRVGQPALTQDSYYAHFLTVRNENFRWRRVNHIDFMCLMMTTDAIADYLALMDANVSSFGLDRYWGFHEWKRGPAHAVLDATPMRHSRPVGGGEAHIGLMDPQREYATFMAQHSLPEYPLLCLEGVPAHTPDAEALRLGLALTGYPREFFKDPNYLRYAAQEVSVAYYRGAGHALGPDDIASPNRPLGEQRLHAADFRIEDARTLSFETSEWQSLEASLEDVDLTSGPVRLLVLAEGKPPAFRMAVGSGQEDPWTDSGERYIDLAVGATLVSLDFDHFGSSRGCLDPVSVRHLSIGGFGLGQPCTLKIWCRLPDGSEPPFLS